MTDFNIPDELKKLPHRPGVYLMRDAEDTIIYVGKAVNLYNRVRSYFREKIGRGPKIDRMVSLIDRFEYIVTDSELEALVLENDLIKEHRPKYNTMLRDDKTYPYIRVSVTEAYPRIQFSRLLRKDKARYFGPFSSAYSVRETIDLINKLYGLRDCNRSLPRDIGKERPCLNYHIGQCCGPCIEGKVSKEEYAGRLEKAMDFLGGNYSPVIKELEARMQEAAAAMEYEEAARWRDLLEHVKSIAQKQKIEDMNSEDRDIIALARDEEDAVVQVFFVRAGRMVGREHYFMKNSEGTEDAFLLSLFVRQFYAGTPFIPREIMLQTECEDAELIGEWLSEKRGGKVRLVIPRIGQKEKLIEMAAANARLVLSQDKEKIKKEESRTIGAVRELEEILGLEGLKRMESYDISNTSGFENVGSMVVYDRGKPKRSDYRKFRIRSVQGPDDYASMREMLSRRFTHGLKEREEQKENGHFDVFPDIILMDGGRGQVGIALEVLQELSLDIPVCGMVKDDHHRTRGLYFNNEELPIDTHSEAFKLLTRIQDEVHRFAIEYHRSLRSKDQTRSVLDDIPGVGPERRKALMRAYDSLEELKNAGVEELRERAGLPRSAAEAVVAFFAGQKYNEEAGVKNPEES